MPPFKVNGLHVVNGKIEPMHEVLHDPTGSEAQADRAFIARPDASKPFVYYEQKDNAWFLARLSEGTEPTLWFYQLNFGEEYVLPMIMDKSKVEALLNDERQAEIKAKLILAAEQYNAIAENTEKQHTSEASTLPMAEEAYTGKLSVADRASLAAILSNSAIEKPAMPEDYEGCQEDWDNDWDQALACALTTNMLNFDKTMPANIHREIKETLRGMFDYLNPARIDQLRFDRPVNEDLTPRPMIGHVYDDVRQYFYDMLEHKSDCPIESLVKLSPSFYKIPIGKLNDENAMVYAGLDDVQYVVMSELVKNFQEFEFYKQEGDQFRGLNHHIISIENLKLISHMMADNIIRTESEERILADFYAIISASSFSDIEEFSDNYDFYKNLIRKQTERKLLEIEVIQESFLRSPDPVEFLESLSHIQVGSLIYSQTSDKLLALCEIPGFVTIDRFSIIFQALPRSKVMNVPLTCINDRESLITVLDRLGAGYDELFISLFGKRRLQFICTNALILSSLLSFTPENQALAIIETISDIGEVLSSFKDLFEMLVCCRSYSAKYALIEKLSHDKRVTLINNYESFYELISCFRLDLWPKLVEMLGSDLLISVFKTSRSGPEQSFGYTLKELPVDHRLPFLCILQKAFGSEIFERLVLPKKLSSLLEMLLNIPAVSYPALFELIGRNLIVEIVKDGSFLSTIVLGLNDKEQKHAFLEYLGFDYVQSLILESCQLFYVLSSFPQAIILEYINAIGSERLKEMVNSAESLSYVFRLVDNASWTKILSMLSEHHLSPLITSMSDLQKFLTLVDRQNIFIPFLRALHDAFGRNFIKKIITDTFSLSYMLNNMNPAEVEELIPSDHLPNIIDCGARLHVLLPQLTQPLRVYIVNQLGNDCVLSYITDSDDLYSLLIHMPEKYQQFFLSSINKNILTIRDTRASTKFYKTEPLMVMIDEAYSRYLTEEEVEIIDVQADIKHNAPLEEINDDQSFIWPVKRKTFADMMLPGGVSVGLATAAGVGLSLAFAPISTLGSLTLTSGVILGLVLAAAFISMAVYALAVHMMTPQTQSTSYVSLVSYNLSIPVHVARDTKVNTQGNDHARSFTWASSL